MRDATHFRRLTGRLAWLLIPNEESFKMAFCVSGLGFSGQLVALPSQRARQTRSRAPICATRDPDSNSCRKEKNQNEQDIEMAPSMSRRRAMLTFGALTGMMIGGWTLQSVEQQGLVGRVGAKELPVAPKDGLETAVFAGGCFWCMEKPFDVLPGVVSTTSGYSGGREMDPSYELVSMGRTNHAECVAVRYDPKQVSYETLLDVFWHNVNPTTRDRQFCDRGHQYRTAIFYTTDAQKVAALRSRDELARNQTFGKVPIVTEIAAAGEFWEAEEYHQDYYRKQPQLYAFYRFNCGRDQWLERQWAEKGTDEKVDQGRSTFNVWDIPSAIWQRINRPF
ncbi:Peptide methionine sulfoxide reductase MsrA [Porphyridium purpureum]|uniref:peptide-methionine (S)-S-oxide reductase n=1 Tax=Porphyridium purpureum TaxID=35688 RepID=A0A5J4YZD8_PORPP|nr:Peptide methionine sulfoxide reductase MsrA [Porphyridium purpureum]|eukprot:POR3408..scf209_3